MSSSDANAETKLQRLIGECSLAIRLEQHYRVSSLCLEINRHLVELFDCECSSIGIDDEFQNEDDLESVARARSQLAQSFEWKFIDKIQARLRHLSWLIDIYGDVLEFVQVRDLACLAKLLGANKSPISKNTTQDTLCTMEPIDIETLSRILRQCAILLKELSGIGASQDGPNPGDGRQGGDLSSREQTRFETKITRSTANPIGFPRYLIHLNPGAEASEFECPAEGEARSLAAISKVIHSKWFDEFHQTTLRRALFESLDRFPILVALWIVAAECQHKTAEHLLSELIDQINHQEVNSCQVDELMQLTQFGSIWLSYKRHYSVTMHQHSGAMQMLYKSDEEDEDEEDDDGDDEDEEAGHSLDGERAGGEQPQKLDSAVNLRDGAELASDSLEQRQQHRHERLQIKIRDQFRVKLRALVDQELLFGKKCLLCNRRPSGDLLEPVKLSACPECQLEFWPLTRTGPSARQSRLFCSLSFQPINWLPLDRLLNARERLRAAANSERAPTSPQQPTVLLVLTANEYAQQVLRAARELDDERGGVLFCAAASKSKEQSGRDGIKQTIGERIDISEKFERLTVLRQAASDDQSLQRDDGEKSPDEEEVELDSNGFENFSQDGDTRDESPDSDADNNEAVGHRESAPSPNGADELDSLRTLSTFLKRRLEIQMQTKRIPTLNSSSSMQLSETLQLVQYQTILRHNSQLRPATASLGTTIPGQWLKQPLDHSGGESHPRLLVYSGDLVPLDFGSDLERASLYLVATKNATRRSVSKNKRQLLEGRRPTNGIDRLSSLAGGVGPSNYLFDGVCSSQPLFGCLDRSPISGLQAGCERLFDQLQLLRVSWRKSQKEVPLRLLKYHQLELMEHTKRKTSPALSADVSDGGEQDQEQGDSSWDLSCPACRGRLVLMRPGCDFMQQAATEAQSNLYHLPAHQPAT